MQVPGDACIKKLKMEKLRARLEKITSQYLFSHVMISLLAFGLIGFMAAIAMNVSYLNPLSKAINGFEFTDSYYQIVQETGDYVHNEDIVIVDFTELYTRRQLADALRQIEACKPRVIGVDCVFEHPKEEDPEGDEMIRDVAATYDNIVFSYKLLDYVNDSTGYTVAMRSFFTDSLDVEQGFTNMQYTLYMNMARVVSYGRPYMGEIEPSFIAKVVNMASPEKQDLPLIDKDISINFTPTDFTVVPPDSISEYAEQIKDKVVLFGTMYDEYDMHFTPLGKMAGVELLAYAGQTLMYGMQVEHFPPLIEVLVSFGLVLLTQILISSFMNFATSRRNKYARNLLSLLFVKTQLLLLWSVFLMWVSYIIFFQYNYDMGLGWAMSATAFLSLATDFYNKVKNLITEK